MSVRVDLLGAEFEIRLVFLRRPHASISGSPVWAWGPVTVFRWRDE